MPNLAFLFFRFYILGVPTGPVLANGTRTRVSEFSLNSETRVRVPFAKTGPVVNKT